MFMKYTMSAIGTLTPTQEIKDEMLASILARYNAYFRDSVEAGYRGERYESAARDLSRSEKARQRNEQKAIRESEKESFAFGGMDALASVVWMMGMQLVHEDESSDKAVGVIELDPATGAEYQRLYAARTENQLISDDEAHSQVSIEEEEGRGRFD